MDKRDELSAKTVELLKSIQTEEDLKQHREELLNLMEDLIRSAVDAIKTFFDSIFGLEPDEKQEQVSRFQDDEYLFTAEVQQELGRLDDLPGAEGYADEFGTEMERRVGPYLEEFGEQMEMLMENLVGGMSAAFQALGEGIASGGQSESEGDQEETYE